MVTVENVDVEVVSEQPEPSWEQKVAWAQRTGNWLPASGGTETSFLTRSGRKLLYCWNPRSGKHAYLDVRQDVILDDEEARLALGG